ncbi:C40 family peptidase, partial [Escherichia coli]|uniref:C40 family peptidase n=1 Tax=Escherichia coli TaxID=562 RepID=UPI0016498076
IINNPNCGKPGIAVNEETVKRLFSEAERNRGKRYVFGANGPSNFDCSSFVCWSFTHSGIKNMPRTTAWRIYTDYCNPVSTGEAKAGDIIFFKNTYNSGS